MVDQHFSAATVALAGRLYASLSRAFLDAARSVDDDIAFGGGWGIGLMAPPGEPPPSSEGPPH